MNDLYDLRDRLDRVHRDLLALAVDASATERARLLAKAEGVTLAAGYVRDALGRAR